MSMSRLKSLILKHTSPCRANSLTPEMELQLLTPLSPLWKQRPEESPFTDDPFWAIYWPGGQALSRYLLDHGCHGRSVLDLGSGGGASALAALAGGAALAEANDVDVAAKVAAEINAEANLPSSLLSKLSTTTTNYLSSGIIPPHFDLLILGDMYFDPDLSEAVDQLSASFLHSRPGVNTVLVGDPGRWLLGDESKLRCRGLRAVAKYSLPEEVKKENSGLKGEGFVFRKYD